MRFVLLAALSACNLAIPAGANTVKAGHARLRPAADRVAPSRLIPADVIVTRVGDTAGAYAFDASVDKALPLEPTESGNPARRLGPAATEELASTPGGKGLIVDYALAGRSARIDCELSMHGMDGSRLAILAEGSKPPGSYRAEWAPAHRPRGVYFVRLKAGAEYRTRAVFLR